jgi:hypothetical protein
MNAMKIMVESGNMARFEWLKKNLSWYIQKNERTVTAMVATSGVRSALERCVRESFPLSTLTFSAAVRHCDMDTIIWLRDMKCPWDLETHHEAINRGDIDIIKWLCDNGCPWNTTSCAIAAKKNTPIVLEILKKRGCPWDEDTCTVALLYENQEVYDWARQKGCPYRRELPADITKETYERRFKRKRNTLCETNITRSIRT